MYSYHPTVRLSANSIVRLSDKSYNKPFIIVELYIPSGRGLLTRDHESWLKKKTI